MSEKEPIETILLRSTFEFLVRETLQRKNLTVALKRDIDSIRRLISEAPESRPKVGRLFVKEWEYKFDDWTTERPRTSHLVMAMLREAGVIVEEP